MASAMATIICPTRVAQRTGSVKSISAGSAPRPSKAFTRSVRTFSRRAVLTTADLKNSPEADTWQNKLTEFMAKGPLNQAKKWLADQQAGEYNKAEVQSKIDTTLAENKVVVFSFSTCPFCLKAKTELTNQGVEFEALELDQLGDGMAIRAQLAEMTNRTSVPNIFINGKNVGGCNDGTPGLMPLIAEGKLKEMIN
mmetsp:Transcript_2513/g.5229  ORF Transcript_2513/g.5229 Transcript_2513/m.5229 type:complete len:196 (-) Transcript_2513:114-701(-)|eukprot:CAMPEP_0118932050 /NCGR_PEP_ID=MMETSP1169-20130426/8961_1 /TAXON_ID=36882 /ORGANISM="Pyramimonas obovata, Strain CCMP722" /LENGTH=195 /DNA_ID=CAMNT_0006874645 /DNA_START=89 /DNA_END=676 /DNA_ORIENTATION=+